MAISNISFTGKMLIKGNPTQQYIIDRELSRHAYGVDGRNKINLPHTRHQNYEYTKISHSATADGDSVHLYATHDEAIGIQNFLKAQKVDIVSKRQAKKAFVGLQNKEIHHCMNFFVDMCNYYKENIEKFVNIPEVQYNATEILDAMKNNMFDYSNLRIKKKIVNVVSSTRL